MEALYERLLRILINGEALDQNTLASDRETLLQQDDALREEHMTRVAKGECDAVE